MFTCGPHSRTMAKSYKRSVAAGTINIVAAEAEKAELEA